MAAKDVFSQKFVVNTKMQMEVEEGFKRDVLAFQEDTKILFQEIMGWFIGSSVTASISTIQVVEDTVRFEVSNLTLKNGEKTLKLTPEGLYYFWAKGSLEVSIHNPNQEPDIPKFNLRWKDEISKLPGWVIISGGVAKIPVQRTEFNQENFFKMISAFA